MRCLVATLLVACGGGAKLAQPPATSSNASYADRVDAARRHDQAATEHEDLARTSEVMPPEVAYQCGDPVLNDQSTTGGMRVTSWQPCFDVAEESAAHQRYLAARERAAAARERDAAAALVRAEAAQCAGIPEREREHSVFAHTQEIADVIPHRESGELSGVWVVFKPVPGMTASWVRRDIACRRAHWAVAGKPASEALADPSLVEDAEVQVFDRHDHVEVLIRTPEPDAAQVALERARRDRAG